MREDVYRPHRCGGTNSGRENRASFARWESRRFDRVCQQALLNRLDPIFEPVFDDQPDIGEGDRRDAMRKVWKEIQSGQEWIVDADLKDFSGRLNRNC
jgi:hypothetical protein